jgi:methyl-accepting chemotaxis protein
VRKSFEGQEEGDKKKGALTVIIPMKLKHKFLLMVAGATAVLLAFAFAWLMSAHSTMLAEKQEKIRSLVEVPYSIVEENQRLEASGKITREEAQGRALAAIQTLRYEGSNYFWINDMHPTMVMHPMKPELNGKDLADIKDPTGKKLFLEMAETVRRAGAGYVFYMWPKPGSEKPVPKASYVKGFQPWGWLIGTGIYIDDVDAAWRSSALKVSAIAALCVAAILIFSWSVARSILTPLGKIVGVLDSVSSGDLTKRLEFQSKDEIGQMGQALNRTLDKMLQVIKGIQSDSQALASASKQLSATSGEMISNARETSNQASVVSSAAGEINSNLQTVATGAEEMSATIKDIARNATEAATVTKDAVQMAAETNRNIAKLGGSSNEIGNVLKVITAIAQQTNLLALNATIEAARAGEAGKGFAVVANEVKELAKETAKATEAINGKISAIQNDTKVAVDSIATISGIIGQMNDITTTIAAAVEEQSVTTNEMSRNIAEAAKNSEAIVESVSGVARVAEGTSRGASESQKAAQELALMSTQLRGVAGEFKVSDNGRSISGNIQQN